MPESASLAQQGGIAGPPDWLAELLGGDVPAEGGAITVGGRHLTMDGGVLRADELVSAAQGQTRETSGFKWSKRDTFEGELAADLRRWLIEKYGDIARADWLKDYGDAPILLDAGCGAAVSGIALFAPVMDRLRYIGVDISSAVDVAKQRFQERGWSAAFLQADLQKLPLPADSVDLLFSEGVLHHTDDTAKSLAAVVRHLKPGGRAIFYVYRKKGPIREFTDDYIRDRMQAMTPAEGWEAIEPLTKLGKALGELDMEVEVPEDIALLEIPAGRINVQRLFYWHVFKAYYSADMTLDEMNHLNFDWYAPRNAHRHTPEEVRAWCADLQLEIEHERIEQAGISIIARKKA